MVDSKHVGANGGRSRGASRDGKLGEAGRGCGVGALPLAELADDGDAGGASMVNAK
jgi:hypothetical protein